MEIDLNTRDTDEYRQWLALLKEIKEIHTTLQSEPNAKGLKLARSMAYNILADIHALIDKTENTEAANAKNEDPLKDINLN